MLIKWFVDQAVLVSSGRRLGPPLENMVVYDPDALGHKKLHQVVGISRTFAGGNMDSILVRNLSHGRVTRKPTVDAFLDLMNEFFHLLAEGARLGDGADIAMPRHDVADIHRLDGPDGLNPFERVGINECGQTRLTDQVPGKRDLLLREVDQ